MNFFGGKSKQIEERETDYESTPAPTPRPAPVIQTPTPPAARPAYGIQEAIVLMRTVPIDQNVELVVAVIKNTLESLKVHVPDIIDDASRRQEEIEHRVGDLKDQIAQFEAQIRTRKEEITRLEADHQETSMVRERLELAERQASGAPKAAPAPSPRPGNRSRPSAVPSMEPARVMVGQTPGGDD
jgi:cell division protein FtsB